jgi:hypothetical protein
VDLGVDLDGNKALWVVWGMKYGARKKTKTYEGCFFPAGLTTQNVGTPNQTMIVAHKTDTPSNSTLIVACSTTQSGNKQLTPIFKNTTRTNRNRGYLLRALRRHIEA